MSNTSFKLFADKMGGTDANNYIGRPGEVFYDTNGQSPMRLSDGETPGGIPFGIASSISKSFNPQFTANGNTIVGVVSTGTYVKQGLIAHFRVNVDFANCNAASFNDSGQFQIKLPFPTTATITIRGGTLHSKPANPANTAIYHIAGITDIDEYSNTTMKLYYSGSTTDLAWKNSTPVGATSNVSHFDISGAYETNTTFS